MVDLVQIVHFQTLPSLEACMETQTKKKIRIMERIRAKMQSTISHLPSQKRKRKHKKNQKAP